MNILRLNLEHVSSSTLIEKDDVIAACGEERYTKLKHKRTTHRK